MQIGKFAAAALAALTAGAAAAATFNAPVTVAANGGSEPGIRVAPDGTLYIATATGLVIGAVPPSASAVYRSDDGGAHWLTTPLGLRQAAISGGDVDLTVAPDSGVISTADLWLGSVSVATSSDKGETWKGVPLDGTFADDRMWVAAVGSSRVYSLVHQIPSGLVVSASPNDGLLYPYHVLAATPVDQTGCLCPPGNLVAEKGGVITDRVAFVYGTTTSGFGFTRSTDSALTWTTTYPGKSVNPSGIVGFPAIADDGKGNLAVVWQPDSTGGFYLVTSGDFGATWSAPKTIETAGTSVYPWVATRNGKTAISYYHTTAQASVSDNVPADAQWTITYRDSSDGFATATDIEAVHKGPICTQGTNCTANRELGDFQEVGIDNAGKSVIAYVIDTANGGTSVRFVKQQ